jgi:2-deoxy-D-gluconate 3-dehydrogenase
MGRVDILVNNAGTIRRADALTFSEKDWDDVLNLNLKSVFFLSQAVARQFIRRAAAEKSLTSPHALVSGRDSRPLVYRLKSGVLG